MDMGMDMNMDLDNEVPSDDPLAVTQDEQESTLTEGTQEREQTMEELLVVLRRTKQVDFNDEYMDPIEWSVRKIFPLPEVYYWDVMEGQPKDSIQKIPWKIRYWHRLVGSLDHASDIVNRWVAQPIAGTLGITDSRFSYVIDNMTEEELQASKRLVAERKKQRNIAEKNEV